MANKIIVKTGSHIVSLSDLLQDLYKDLVDSGSFKQILPAAPAATVDITSGNGKFVLESTDNLNPVNETQPYRLYMEVVDNERIKVAVANPIQITDDGEIASYPGDATYRASNKTGMLGTDWADTTSPENDNPTDTAWVVRSLSAYSSGDLSGSPLSYTMSISDHGFAVFVWGDDMEHKPRSSWLVVQNPVDKVEGKPRIDELSPIWCVYSNNNTPNGIIQASELGPWLAEVAANNDRGNKGPVPPGGGAAPPAAMTADQLIEAVGDLCKAPIGGFSHIYNTTKPPSVLMPDTTSVYKFVVSEADVFVPTPSVRADIDTQDSAAIINTRNQVAIATGNRYLVTMPNRLNTQRYAYTDELDLIGYTSADVISQDSVVPVTVYEEETPRKYLATKTSGAYNTGYRVMVLVEHDDGL